MTLINYVAISLHLTHHQRPLKLTNNILLIDIDNGIDEHETSMYDKVGILH